MKFILKRSFIVSIILISSISLFAGVKLYKFKSKPNNTIKISGDLKAGSLIEDLSWASKSSVACFPGTQNTKFRGNHVLYVTSIPAYSEMTVKLIPENPSKNFSLYGYQTETNNFPIVPNLNSCVTCEADYKWDYPKRGQTQDHTRKISFNSIRNPYNIFIGVAGSKGVVDGKFNLVISLKTKEQSTSIQKPLKLYRIEIKKGTVQNFKANLSDGVIVNDLSWASRSSVACFPATQNEKFRGNHILFITTIPARTKMEITVVPKDKKSNMSIYAFMTGKSSNAMIPNLNSCVTCEAEHKWDYPKRGKTQDHTRTVYLNTVSRGYRVVIGVAGSKGVVDGEFNLVIKTE